MRLICRARYRSAAGAWEPGADVHVKDELGEFLMRDSPGAFEVAADEPPAKNKTKTTSGVEAVDRRERGGEVR